MKMKKLLYTLKHKKAFLLTEKKLLGRISLSGIFHDTDKLLLLIFCSPKMSSKIHRKFSKHHSKANSKKHYLQMIVDWECASLTKADKQLNARETLYAYYPQLICVINPLLEELNL